MKYNYKIIAFKLLFVVIAILYQSNINSFAQLGTSCPPCAKEFKDFKQAETDLLTAIINNNNALARKVRAYAAFNTIAAQHSAAFDAWNSCTSGCFLLWLEVQRLEAVLNLIMDELDHSIEACHVTLAALHAAILKKTQTEVAYYTCMARPFQPCQKCVNGVVVADDSQSRFFYPCKKCVAGNLVNDNPVLVACEKCVDGKIQHFCAAPDTCCNGICGPKKYQYTITTTVTTCAGVSLPYIRTLTTTSPGSITPGCTTTGRLFHSYGRCSGGSITQVCYSTPALMPCP